MKYVLSDGIKVVEVDYEFSECGYVILNGNWMSFKVGRDIYDIEVVVKKVVVVM